MKIITITTNQSGLEFGTGDICINGGGYIDNENNKVGVVAFSNQEPRKIGVEGEIKVGQECKLEDVPVIMTFMKKESIDMVIKALLDAREFMD